MNLELNDAVQSEVSDMRKSFIKRDGKQVIISLPMFHLKEGLKFRDTGKLKSVLVPLDTNTIATLTDIENFVKARMPEEKYKPLWLNRSMFVSVSNWCKFEMVNVDGTTRVVCEDEESPFGAGLYNLDIHVSHVYQGPHKNGETCSLSLFVTKISYEPASNLAECLNSSFQ